MKALLVIAHGSRRDQANEEFRAFVQSIGQKTSESYHFVEPAFLEICPPSISDAAAVLIEKGVTHINVYPYFLNTGRHVATDIPAIVNRLQEAHPDCDIQLLEYFGKSKEILDFTLRHLSLQDAP